MASKVLKRLISKGIIVDKNEREYIGGHVYRRSRGYWTVKQIASETNEYPFSPSSEVTNNLRKLVNK